MNFHNLGKNTDLKYELVFILGVYYCFNLVIIMVAVFLSALVVNVCRAGETKRKVPRWLKKVNKITS